MTKNGFIECDIQDFGASKFKAILADPPWNFKTYSKKGRDRCPDARHYNVMTYLDILKLGTQIDYVAADDCVLFLWITDPFLMQAAEVMNAWGFQYSTVAFTWAKTGKKAEWPMGTGYWTRANPEMCLLGRRGSPKRKNADVRQLMVSPRREHSRKPDETHERIERLVDGPYLELFARQPRKGWTVWGNQTDLFGADNE